MIYRLIGCAALALCLCTFSLAAGGGKSKTSKDDVGIIEIYKNKGGEYRYRIKNAEGKTIAMPLPQMSWEKKDDCLKAIEDLKNTLIKAKPTDVKE